MADLSIIIGSDFDITGTVYSSGTTPQDITGATIKCMVKNTNSDADGAAVLTKTGSTVTPASGTYKVTFAASDTNSLTPRTYYLEVVVKLASGVYIRNGENYLIMANNIIKTLP